MQHFIDNQTVFDEVDLITPTSTAKYPLGKIVVVREAANSSSETASKAVKKFMYVKAHTGLTQYQPYVIGFSATAGAEVITAAPATLAAVGSLLCVPQVAFTSAYYGFVQIQGDCTVKKTSETYVAGDFLEVLNTGTALVVDGTSGSTARSINSKAISKAAGSAAASVSAYLLGYNSTVAAS